MWSSAILKWAHRVPLVLLGVWVLVLVGLCVPVVQKAALFVHWVNYPLFAKYDNPEHYGLARTYTRLIHIISHCQVGLIGGSVQNPEFQDQYVGRGITWRVAHPVHRYPLVRICGCHSDAQVTDLSRPRSFYLSVEQDFPPQRALPKEAFEWAIVERPTVVYFHGNVGALVPLVSRDCR